MGLTLENEPGQTPLSEEEMEGLLIASIATQADLNEFEQENIEQAIEWSLGKKLRREQVVSIDFILQIHKRMYGDVWRWAGQFRRTQKNIGIDWWLIPTAITQLLDDTNYWIDEATYNLRFASNTGWSAYIVFQTATEDTVD